MAPLDPNSLDDRDAELIRRALPAFAWYMKRYVRLRAEGLQHLSGGATLLVGNHNGGMAGADLPATLGMLWQQLGPEAPFYQLAHDFAMTQFTPLGRLLRRFGALRAHPDNARRALLAGAHVLVYPGGDIEAYRAFSKRDSIVLGSRRGYLRVARETGAAIQPIVAAGAHRSAIILSEGQTIARAARLKRWARLERFPTALCLPWGVALGPWLPYLPLPFQVRLRVLPKTWIGDHEPIEAAHSRIVASMQAALSELVSRHR
jgi:1-acyl-sn-glycerol-3-phosphate acyltransferase